MDALLFLQAVFRGDSGSQTCAALRRLHGLSMGNLTWVAGLRRYSSWRYRSGTGHPVNLT